MDEDTERLGFVVQKVKFKVILVFRKIDQVQIFRLWWWFLIFSTCARPSTWQKIRGEFFRKFRHKLQILALLFHFLARFLLIFSLNAQFLVPSLCKSDSQFTLKRGKVQTYIQNVCCFANLLVNDRKKREKKEKWKFNQIQIREKNSGKSFTVL